MFIVQLVKMYNGVTAGIFALIYGKFHELLSKNVVTAIIPQAMLL